MTVLTPFFIRREYMDLGSLFDILHDENRVLKEEVLHSVQQDISTGLRFLHGSDPPLIHGDLKVSAFGSLVFYFL